MSAETKAVIRFLEALQGYRAKLGELRTELIQKGAKNASVEFSLGVPFRMHTANSTSSTLSGTVSLGVQAVPAAGAPVDFEITIRWDAENWYIDTEIWADDRLHNQRLLRTFPQRSTASLDECLEQIDAAIDDLRRSAEFAAVLA